MSKRAKIIRENELSKLVFHQKVISSLANELGLPDLRAGRLVIRDERNWRENEKEIEYCWLVNIARSLVGWCWLFAIKFKESNFRNIANSEELVQGIFTVSKKGAIEIYYQEKQSFNFEDAVKNLTVYDLFDVSTGITLDGVNYEYLVFTPNSKVRMSINNPNSDNWKAWEVEVNKLGKYLAQKSGKAELKELFEWNTEE